MQKYRGPDIRFVFYAPNCNHSTDYLFVLNEAAAHQYMLVITWKKVKKRIRSTTVLAFLLLRFGRQLAIMQLCRLWILYVTKFKSK
jgi:hypothetical protein